MMSMMQKIATIVAVLGIILYLIKVPLRFQINCLYGRVLYIGKYCTVLHVLYKHIVLPDSNSTYLCSVLT
jgi:hypothetical protein